MTVYPEHFLRRVAQPTSPTRSPQPCDPRSDWPPRRQPFVLSGLRTLFLSCGSFSHSHRLFSISCALFDKNTGGDIPDLYSLYSVSVPSVFLWQTGSVFGFEPSTVDYEPSPAPKRKNASPQVLCLPLLRTPRRVSPFPATHTQTPGMVVPRCS